MVNDKDIVRGEKPSEEDIEWLKYGRELIRGSPSIIDENAKSFVTLSSTLLTIFTGAVTLFKFNERLVLAYINWIIITIPIVLWLLSIVCNVYVYFPGKYRFDNSCTTELVKTSKKINDIKYNRLKFGAIFFILAIICSILAVLWMGSQMLPLSPQATNNMIYLVSVSNNPVKHNISVNLICTVPKNAILSSIYKVNDSDVDKNSINHVLHIDNNSSLEGCLIPINETTINRHFIMAIKG